MKNGGEGNKSEFHCFIAKGTQKLLAETRNSDSILLSQVNV